MRKNFLLASFLSILMIFGFLPKTFAAELVIFHTNDMHARIVKGDDNGTTIGLAELAGAVKSFKKNHKDTFWFDAGDTLHGMPRINISDGQNIIPLLNMAGLDAFVPGNHDYNYSSDQLERIAKKLNFPTLSANTVRRSNHEFIFQPYKIYNLSDGTKVGVFGLTTPETAYKAFPKYVATIEFLNPVESAKKMIDELRSQCDVIIAVMHMGVDKSSEFTSERIAKETEGIDVIIDGHSHTELPNGLQVGNTLIAQTGCYEHNLGQVEISVDNHKITNKQAKLLNANDVKKISAKPDEKLLKVVTDLERRTQKHFSTVIAKSDRQLTGERSIVRREECELGNLIADAYRWKANADIAFINGGGIRTDLPAGNVTRGDVLSILPFGNKLAVVEANGKIVRAVLEHSVFGYPATFGGFLQVSGVSFTFDPEKSIGQRVGEIFVNGQPLDENKIYKIAATDFTIAGGDDYTMLKDLEIIADYGSGDEIVTEYINKIGLKGIELGRIKNLHEMPESE